eukprot:TRINITY_DN7975_c1_g1_i1.p1 TRINITY_DN7975_c1_g1~~TRINITY_DN7975_c1_g1_i1.p1  ORF type:complete len:186 (+),score=48.00 TRINITY_DN7975_c1_g1_i1:70-558(+)
MAVPGWDRHGEEKKYRKDVDVNDNPKHVGEPLRKLSLEDRLELRKQAREQTRRKSVSAFLETEEDSEEDELYQQAAKRSKSGDDVSGNSAEDFELDIVQVAKANGKSKVVVSLDEDDVKRAAIARARRARKRAQDKATSAAATSPSAASPPPEDLEKVQVLE